MNFCVRYNYKYKNINEIDEVIIGTLGDLRTYLKERKEIDITQKLVVDLETIGADNLSVFKIVELVEDKNLGVRFRISPQQAALSKLFSDLGVPYFFNIVVNDFKGLCDIIDNYKVSEVYIGGDLGFELRDAKQLCAAKGIKIRTLPNISQSSGPLKETDYDFKSFFIRPENIKDYAEYVDTFEIFETKPASSRFKVYEIYKSGVWEGKLSELVTGLSLDVSLKNTDLNLFSKLFIKRMNCGKMCRCINDCDYCDRAISVMKMSSGIIEKIEKDKDKVD